MASVADTGSEPPVAPVVAMVAGEASGDLLAALLLQGLQARWPGLAASGIGGSAMVQRGFHAWWPSDKLAVRGYVEVLRHYREIVGIRKRLRERLLAQPPDLFIGVDAPDFNLDLERDLKRHGIKTVHFVSPSVWAWRADRLEKMRQCVDHVLCLFPFEPDLLHAHGVSASFVGHPLAALIPMVPDRAAARAALGIDDAEQVLAILPGSRRSEITYLARRFFDAAAILLRDRPRLRCIVPALPPLRQTIVDMAQQAGVADRILILDGQSHLALAACDVTLIASGTATLEAALFKRPMVIAYNMHWLSWRIMRSKRLQPWVGLPNILCREFVVPELLQDAATAPALAAAVTRWLDQPKAVDDLQQRFAQLHQSLLRDTPQLCADVIGQVLHA